MRKQIARSFTLAVILVLATSGSPLAETVSFGPVNTSAVVDGSLQVMINLRENSSTGPLVKDITFGELADIGTGTLRSNDNPGLRGSVVAMITVNSHKVPYIVSQNGTVMQNAALDSLPAGACVVTPVYSAADNGGSGLPPGSTVGPGGSFVSTNKLIYQSSPKQGLLRTVQAHYSITDDATAGATEGVPLDQPAGTYSGTVTITVVTQGGPILDP